MQRGRGPGEQPGHDRGSPAAALLAPLAVLALLGVGACTSPQFPACEGDHHCRVGDGPQGYCVDGFCTQCRETSQCAVLFDRRYECAAGACQPIEGYCDAEFPCTGGARCEQNRCACRCRDDSECASGTLCDGCQCVALPRCLVDADCPYAHRCAASGECVAAPDAVQGPECTDDAQCPPNHLCREGRCAEGCECMSDEDCFEPKLCMECRCIGL